MKEMLGGCSVCCDDTGWAENPLVYCDGPNCNVAVHQACYGIRSVPKGEWLCRKCEAYKEKNIKAKCELCPSKDGALKPTENGQWAHVVCALYIPEVTFLDVTTMEPVKLSEIPRDRFNRTCYICEEKNNKGSKSSTYGACMSCNKAGCKLSFHVTCAQSVGLLCEEAGIYYDNVKYVGYCKHHYSKLKKSNNIKPIAPYRPQSNLENSSAECSPEKQAVSTKADTDIQATKQKKDLTEFNKKKLTIINNNNDKTVNEKKIKELSFPNIPSNERNKSQPHIVSTHPSGNLIISIGAKPQTITSGIKNLHSNDLESGNPTKYQKMDSVMSTDKPKKNQNSEVLKIVEEPNLSRMENANTIIKSNVSGANKLHLPESNARKNETSVINIPFNATMPKKEPEKKIFENNSSAPHMLGNSLNPSSSMAQTMADTLSEEIETHKKYGGDKNLSAGQQQSSYKGPQLHRRFPKPSTSQSSTVSQSQGSASSWSSIPNGLNNSTHELEDLLERQWEQGGALLMEQAQHFDIASLLTCLYQLKSENVNLEDELATYTRRRDHLLAVNARLAIPLPPQNTGNRTPASTSSAPTSSHSEAFVHSRPNYQSSLQRIDSQLQHNYQNQMSNMHQVHHSMSNNIPSHVVIRGGVGQDPRLDNRRQSNQNSGQMNLNQMYQPNPQQLPSMGLPHHQLGMDGLPKHS
ncbi:protein AF-10-like [Adelges cooleyi]|uniref:protein AF-10-like n=1 Tax=Adelges cooleyi TaxID=133065 RepID=UPI00218010F3|nr:protein AF-10-like [Adelges cooleyi]XP_050426554.1 protein AF-10-like [Adelges cooleyi]